MVEAGVRLQSARSVVQDAIWWLGRTVEDYEYNPDNVDSKLGA